MKHTAITAVAVSLLAILPGLVRGDNGGGESAEKTPHRVPKIEAPVSVDGVLDEGIWDDALVLGVNTEVRPSENVPAPVETEMLLAYDETHFYVAFRAHDPDPTRICATICDRDRMWDDEWVVIGIDTFDTQRGSFEFAVNPLGIQGDTAGGIFGDGNSWDAIWDSAGQINGDGYVVEMAIPFSSLRFQRTEGDQIWGVDAVRSYPRDVRHHIGLYARDRDNNCYYCQMEKLVGFAGVSPGRNIELDPTVSAIRTQEREDWTEGPFLEAVEDYDVGLTARWGVTPNMTFSAAVNPDFSQVEADVMQLDINTRYALWYPERRPFFLEGAGIFENVYTRSIADPRWGVKLTGKEGGNDFGVFVAEDEITNLIFPGSQGSDSKSLNLRSTAAALRYQRDVGEQSNIGAFFNSRDGDDYRNRFGGVDGEFWLTDADVVRFEALGSLTDYPDSVDLEIEQPTDEFSGDAYHVSYNHSTSSFDWYANYNDVGRNIRNDLGFRTMAGYESMSGGWGHTWQEDSDHWWTMINVGNGFNYQEEEDGTILSRGTSFWVNYSGRKQSFANLNGWLGEDLYSGEMFDVWNMHYDAGFWPTGQLFVMVYGSFGEGIDYSNVRPGRNLSVTPRAEYKIGRHLTLEYEHRYSRMEVDGGRLYTANLDYLKAVYQFSSRAFLRAVLQYADYQYDTALYLDDQDPEEQALRSQLLFSYKINPQTVFFLGYSDSRAGDQETDLTQTARTFFAKLGYAFML